MAEIRPFKAIRPQVEHVAEMAALPYDVYTRQEAKKAVAGRPLSFLNIDRPETAFSADADMYAPEVYESGADYLKKLQKEGYYQSEESPAYYLYELTMKGRSQTGLVACSAISDYENDIIKKHENTLKAKEEDRIRHITALGAQTGPIFLAYKGVEAMKGLQEEIKQTQTPLYEFSDADEVRQRIWLIDEPETVAKITSIFEEIPATYIADGHHRAASAVAVGKKLREENPEHTGNEEYNYFLSVLFAADELEIMDYNRVIKRSVGLTEDETMAKLLEKFTLLKSDGAPLKPEKKGQVALYIGAEWYLLEEKSDYVLSGPVDGMDVSFLQREVLGPIFGIEDPKTDKNISFVGGIKGLKELEKQVKEGALCAFGMYPTSMTELLAVADGGLLMPPKSTWFEPKLLSGIFIHSLTD
ncbi:uncharacterized protein (DUF1015 family) [Lachnospiraceae bacterium PF1-21]